MITHNDTRESGAGRGCGMGRTEGAATIIAKVVMSGRFCMWPYRTYVGGKQKLKTIN